jgi:hypothetical protein
VLAVANNEVDSESFWADARTLEPPDGRSIAVSSFHSAVERSPDGRTRALGADERGYVQLVDLDRMRSLGTIDTGAGGFIERRAGWQEEGETQEDHRVRQAIPALAVEPSGGRALVVPAGDRVAEVDLETMRVAYHDLSEPVSFLGRLLDWLEPAAEVNVRDGPERTAVRLPSGLVALSGSNYVADGQGLVETQ